jgi:hypothetical protein
VRLVAADPDIETVIGRIRSGVLNLQPDFQRGEVWSIGKKQRLIDSILRDWHVPPVHIIQLPETNKTEVLDGQQRLVAIRDFIDGIFPVDGTIEPYEERLEDLDGLRFHELPEEWQRHVNQFTLRVFRLTDYRAEEPGELFYRLNQNVALTSAEQRNAFFGPSRQQVRSLVERMEDAGVEKQYVGFSNSRMAYDDVVARLCKAIEIGYLTEKVTANMLTDRYRSSEPFADEVTHLAAHAIEIFAHARHRGGHALRLNKATLFSWLWFVAEGAVASGSEFNPETFSDYLGYFEEVRSSLRSNRQSLDGSGQGGWLSRRWVSLMLRIYDDRSTSRVSDVASVVLRNGVVWMLYSNFRTAFQGYPEPTFSPALVEVFKSDEPPFHQGNPEAWLYDAIGENEWGFLWRRFPGDGDRS